jgi:hypothetical protein
VLTSLHATGGYERERFFGDPWASIVDFVMLAILLWAATGLVMLWRERGTRRMGALALAGGIILVAVLLPGL